MSTVDDIYHQGTGGVDGVAEAGDHFGGAVAAGNFMKSYPTTVFIGRDGKVHRIHSGFAGPATGKHHEAMVAEMESHLESLLGEQ